MTLLPRQYKRRKDDGQCVKPRDNIRKEKMDKEKAVSLLDYQVATSMEPSVVDADYYVRHYQEFLGKYIAHSNPSKDTMNSYASSINQFLKWCIANKRHPLTFHDYQMRIYLEWLGSKGYKKPTISFKVKAIRHFFDVAVRLNLIDVNPCADISIPGASSEEQIHFFTPDQIYEIVQVFEKLEDPFQRTRNIAMLYLMGVEGLRNVEVHRMNRSDVNWDLGSITIHGKGRDRIVWPCKDTFEKLDLYLSACIKPADAPGSLTPMFLSGSRECPGTRISRNGIRYIIDNALKASGYKKEGVSCHAFRHSTGTNLYAATKDLRLVQDTLGHKDPQTTARYAHLQERMTKRSTEAIVPKKK